MKEHANSRLVTCAISLPGLQADDLESVYSCYDKRSTYCILGNCTGVGHENSGRTGKLSKNQLKEIICKILKVYLGDNKVKEEIQMLKYKRQANKQMEI